MGWGGIVQRMQIILVDGPQNPSEFWLHELAKTARKDEDATSMIFSASTLVQGFSMSEEVFPTCLEFFDDVCSLINMLPIKDGEQIDRKLLHELLIETARECGTTWWFAMRERVALLFGIMHACAIQRRALTKTTEDELADLVNGLNLNNDEFAIMADLATSLGGLNVENEAPDIVTELAGSLNA